MEGAGGSEGVKKNRGDAKVTLYVGGSFPRLKISLEAMDGRVENRPQWMLRLLTQCWQPALPANHKHMKHSPNLQSNALA